MVGLKYEKIGTDGMRSRALYFAPEWVEAPTLSRLGSNTDKVFRRLRAAGEHGATIRRMATEAGLTTSQVKHALAGLQAGIRACVLVQARSVSKNINFVATRILHYLRWDDSERAQLALDWFLGRHATHPGILGTVAETVLLKIQKDAFSVLGVIFTPDEAITIAQRAVHWLLDLMRSASLTSTVWSEENRILVRDGAQIIDFMKFRSRRAYEMLDGGNEERMEGMLLLLTGLQRKSV